MRPSDVLVVVVFALGELLALSQVRRTWRGESLGAMRRNVGWWWPPGSGLSRGMIRGTALAPFVGLPFLATGILVVLIRGGTLSRSDPLVSAAVWTFAGATGIGIACLVSIILLNRPSWMVPPGLRGEEGVLQGWVRRRRGRR